jgi:hypothetical protein
MTRNPSDADLGELAQLAADLRSWSPDISPDRFAGRGIVIAAGGSAVFTNAYVLIDVLRNTLGCRLPIEVWHFGPAEMSPAMASLLEGLGVTLVDAEPLIRQHGAAVRDGWQLKPFALLWSSFAEVLLLDADQVPVTDPAQCFDWPEYVQNGAVFWPDIIDLLEANPIWGALGLSARRARSMESGQVLVDKRRHLRALAITGRLNAAADLLYAIIYGDKDSFLLGWELAGAAFAMVPHRPFRDDGMLVQRDFSGQPLFQHRTGAKWRYDGEQTKLTNFVHEDACLAALGRLARHWGGAVFHQPDRSAVARRAEADLIAAGVMSLEIGGDERLHFELLPYGEIGRGRAGDRRNWWCAEDGGRLILNLARNEGITYRFERADPGLWEGWRLRPPQTSARLTLQWQPSAGGAAVPGLADQLLRASGFGRPEFEPAELTQALVLLARVEPGVMSRLRHIAGTTPSTQTETWTALLARLEQETASNRADINIHTGSLQRGYTQPNAADEAD